MLLSLQLASFFTAASLMVLGAVAVIFIDNLIKKVIALSFIADSVNLFLVTLGYREGGIVYIYLPGMSSAWFAQHASYPLPFALVLTSIVIGASTLAVMLGIIIILYQKHGTISASRVLED